MIAKMFQSFLDPEIVSRQVFAERPDAEMLLKFIYPSQLETTYGGTAPVVTCFWPPRMPEMTEIIGKEERCPDLPQYSIVDRKDYISFASKHPQLVIMPKQLRKDLAPLSHEMHH